jgi:outer membrane protein OmpA-like peptidoglycan-associated protein
MKSIFIFLLCLMLGACSSWGKKQRSGTAVGAASGGAIGAVLGNKSGNAATGAAIGAAAGGAIGNVLGRRMDQQAKELNQVAETKRTDEGIVTKLKGDILFDTGKATLKPQAIERVDELADIIKKYPEDRITVVGHTDSTGDAHYNQILSMQRAEAVKLRMIQSGVPDRAVKVAGLGESSPIAENDDTKGRTKNRRVELQITAEQQAKR